MGSQCLPMGLYGFLWVLVRPYGVLWALFGVGLYVSLWVPLWVPVGSLWVSMGPYRSPWVPVVSLWVSMGPYVFLWV